MLKSFVKLDDKNILYMGNSSTAKVLGQEKVDLSLTSGKHLILNNVLYVSEIWKIVLANFLVNLVLK